MYRRYCINNDVYSYVRGISLISNTVELLACVFNTAYPHASLPSCNGGRYSTEPAVTVFLKKKDHKKYGCNNRGRRKIPTVPEQHINRSP
ncbi:hypothetical protein RRG08_003454 [Elysia crispata]|uniref:Uncharacterized protein n=1 Tax=Elysia crispata TaxID=231223 RepID=A0AAE1DVM4_9GAST|nr:hypothetical protein RRG08_003454 [Elysia crispata]